MTSFAFLFRPSIKDGNNHQGSIYLRIIHQRRTKTLTLPHKIYPHEWNKKDRKLFLPFQTNERSKELAKIASKIQNYSQQLSNIIKTLNNNQRNFSLEDIIYQFRFKEKSFNLSNYVDKLTSSLLQTDQERTARAYRTVSAKFIEFNNGDIPLGQINSEIIKDFECNMKTKGKSLNTISFYMRNLRAIYNKAIKEKLILDDETQPFSDVFTGLQQTKKRALDIQELSLLNNISFSELLNNRNKDQLNKTDRIIDESLYFAWRLFFFCFHARGMSFVDMAYLKKENIQDGIIIYYRKKTGQQIEVKITPILQSIINSFSASSNISPYIFPIIVHHNKSPRLQYESALRIQNIRLKKLSKLVGLKQCLTTHVSRHSWATIAKKENLPLWVISEGLGHSDEKTTYTYLASFDRSVLDQANDIIYNALNRNSKWKHMSR